MHTLEVVGRGLFVSGLLVCAVCAFVAVANPVGFLGWLLGVLVMFAGRAVEKAGWYVRDAERVARRLADALTPPAARAEEV